MKKLLFFLLFVFSIRPLFPLTGLKVGDKIPKTELKTIDGRSFDLLSGQHVLIFYRGSWCPYCIKQLKGIDAIYSELIKNANVLAISVDKDSVAQKMKKRFNFSFHIVSDSRAKLLKQFKIVNKLEQSLVEKYKSAYQIDIESDSGKNHHMIAHPGIFILNAGEIVFADVHTDYKVRTEARLLLNAVKKL